ncbi:hypothetical protein HDE_06247 [Halotydeus destructor]|nr:hypothetical protein HDE_06247 [Halotydeus destructor]
MTDCYRNIHGIRINLNVKDTPKYFLLNLRLIRNNLGSIVLQSAVSTLLLCLVMRRCCSDGFGISLESNSWVCLLVLLTGLVLIVILWNEVEEESLTYINVLDGIQHCETNKLGMSTQRFLPSKDIILSEVINNNQVHYVLNVILANGQLVPLLTRTKPRLEVLRLVYSTLITRMKE